MTFEVGQKLICKSNSATKTLFPHGYWPIVGTIYEVYAADTYATKDLVAVRGPSHRGSYRTMAFAMEDFEIYCDSPLKSFINSVEQELTSPSSSGPGQL